MKRKLTTALLTAVLLLGLAIMLYPTASDYYNSFHQSRAIANYAEAVATIDQETYARLWTQATDYNQNLLGRSNPFFLTQEERAVYQDVLNYSGNGIMGYIEIPKLGCELPVYHSTDEAVLQIAIGHIEGSSLPVGGASTHCVLSGHRGLPSARLFTDLNLLETGDTFLLQVLDETLTYEVDQIRTVLPDELQDIYIVPGQDLCTLVTCTPYGVNSHRLLVRGHRVENAAQSLSVRVVADAIRVDPLLAAPLAAAPMLLLLLVWLFWGGPGVKQSPSAASKTPKVRRTRTPGRDPSPSDTERRDKA